MKPEKPEENQEEALTSIHGAYTLATAPEEGSSEVDEIIVKHFLNTLAEVAMEIVSRQVNR